MNRYWFRIISIIYCINLEINELFLFNRYLLRYLFQTYIYYYNMEVIKMCLMIDYKLQRAFRLRLVLLFKTAQLQDMIIKRKRVLSFLDYIINMI